MKKKKIQHPKLYFNFNCTNDGLELFYYSNQLDAKGKRSIKSSLNSNLSSFSNKKLQALNQKEYDKLLIYILRQKRIVKTYLQKGMNAQYQIIKESLELMYNFKSEFEEFMLNFNKKL